MQGNVRFVYDFELAEGSGELRQVLKQINLNGFKLITVTQTGLLYTIIFRRQAP